MSKYSQFFTIINKIGLTKEEAVMEFTNGRTDSLTSLNDSEFKELMRKLSTLNTPPPGDIMRKKMIGIAKSMHWGNNTKEILLRIDDWCIKQKFRKKLMQLDLAELSTMLTIFEQKVYNDYLSALNK